MQRSHPTYRIILSLFFSIVMLSGPAVASQETHSTPVQTGDTTEVRLLSIDGDTGDLTILDGMSGEAVATFPAAGDPGFVVGTASDSGETLLVHYYDGNKVVLLDSGISLKNHGSHMDLKTGAPAVHTTMDAIGPAHFWAKDGYIATVSDGDNAIYLWNEQELATNPEPKVIPLQIDKPDHGSIVIANDTIYMGFYGNGRVQTYALDGTLINADISSCPATHGEAVVGDLVLFACEEDVLILNKEGEQGRIAYPTIDGEPIRSNLLVATANPNIVVGDSPEGLIVLDLESQTSSLLKMDTPIRTINTVNDTVVALDANGTLHGVDAEKMAVLWSTPVAMGHSLFSPEESNMFYPFVGTGMGNVYVADPGTGAIVVVDAATGEITKTFDVGGRPARVVVIIATGFKH